MQRVRYLHQMDFVLCLAQIISIVGF